MLLTHLSTTFGNTFRKTGIIKHCSSSKTKEQVLKAIFWEVRSKILGGRKFQKNVTNFVYFDILFYKLSSTIDSETFIPNSCYIKVVKFALEFQHQRTKSSCMRV
jgi:hypothetical protein